MDHDLGKVEAYFRGFHDLEPRAGHAVREAITSAIAGRYTGRFSVDELDKTEKTNIGIKVQKLVLDAFGLPDVRPLDTRVGDVDVDVKFTIKSNWEIPEEALGEVCLLICASDEESTFSMGLLRTSEDVLNKARNRDRKRTINRDGRKAIRWLVQGGALPDNLLLHLSAEDREAIMAKTSGQQRITEFFRRCMGTIADGTTVETLAAQRDSSKRVRDARKILKEEGVGIYSDRDNVKLKGIGIGPLGRGEWISLPLTQVPGKIPEPGEE